MGSSSGTGWVEEELRPRNAPLEYWFLRTGTADVAFLVDWILRRHDRTAEVRVSLWVRGRGRVLRARGTTWRADATGVRAMGCALSTSASSGVVDDVRWDLRHEQGTWLLEPAPAPARLLRPFDLQLAARPKARFAGAVEVGGETFDLEDATGTLVHYWGRRLPDSWVWVSADGLGEDGTAVEAAVFRSRLWGVPGPVVTAGYVAVHGGTPKGAKSVVAPAYGRVSARGDLTAFELHGRNGRLSLHLTARAPADVFNDLGEGIRQTLLGDVTMVGVGSCEGSAGLEVRGAPFLG